MTQFHGTRGFSLRRAPAAVRALITAFLIMATLGVGLGMVNYQVRTGLTADGSAAWYRGAVSDAPIGEGQLTGPSPLAEKTPLELLDATHPHLFNQAFLIFVLGHIVALCGVSPRLKTALYLGGFGGVLVDTLSPWLIRFVHPGFTWLQLAGHVVLALSFLGLVLLPLREMWGGVARRAGGPAGAS